MEDQLFHTSTKTSQGFNKYVINLSWIVLITSLLMTVPILPTAPLIKALLLFRFVSAQKVWLRMCNSVQSIRARLMFCPITELGLTLLYRPAVTNCMLGLFDSQPHISVLSSFLRRKQVLQGFYVNVSLEADVRVCEGQTFSFPNNAPVVKLIKQTTQSQMHSKG